MTPILIGGAGFVSLFFYDLCQVNEKRGLARALSIIGYTAIVTSTVLLLVGSPAPAAGPIVAILGAIAAGAGLLLLVYSVVIEIPIALRRRRKKNAAAGTGSEGGRSVVRNGTYGVVRHPGFLWYLLLQAGLSRLPLP